MGIKDKTQKRNLHISSKIPFMEDGSLTQEPKSHSPQCFSMTSTCVLEGFPGGLVAKNPPCNARDISSIPGLGRPHVLQATKHMSQLLNPSSRATAMGSRVTTTEAPAPRAQTLQQGTPLQREARTPQLEKKPRQQRRHSTARSLTNK